MRKILFLFLAFALVLAGCANVGNQASSSAGQVSGANNQSASGSLIIEPDYGIGPYLMAINKAKQTIDVNSYLLTDPDLVLALEKKARAGVTVRVMVGGNPYGDSGAPAAERVEFTSPNMKFKLAPPQFEGRYVYDHAKYLVVDAAGPDREAILGSSNMDKSDLGATNSVYADAARNREYDYDTSDPAVVADLEAIFDADWNGQPVHLAHPGPLVVSPGSESQLVSLIQGAKQRLHIESEELGNDRPVLDAIIAAARRGVQVEIVLPTNLSAGNRRCRN